MHQRQPAKALCMYKEKKKKRKEKEKEETTSFGVNLMRSQVLYQAAQDINLCAYT